MNKRRLLITAGGTGGHLYPAQSIADKIRDSVSEVEICFAGGGLATCKFFEQTKYRFQGVSCGRFSPSGSFGILKGVYSAIGLLREFKPDLVVGFGSYHTFPVLAASVLMRKPILLHEANSIPGRVNRLFSRYSIATGIHFPGAVAYLKGPCCHVGMPMRDRFAADRPDRQQAADYFGLDPAVKTILVMGGSLGAKAVNDLIAASASYLQQKPLQIIHLVGSSTDPLPFTQRYSQLGIRNIVRPYEARTEFAWAHADAAITRAGASSLAERLAFSVPGILIPYPHAADDHQTVNALEFQKAFGGVITLQEQTADPIGLAKELKSFLTFPKPFLNTNTCKIDFYNLVSQHLGELI